jgi:hypothetical protein
MAAAVNRPKSFIPPTPKAEEFYTFSRYKIFFLGRKNPSWFTQLTFYFGLLSFLYFLIWNLLNFLAVSMVSVYPKAEKVKVLFVELGLKYDLIDPMKNIKWMALTNMLSATVMFFGLIIIWRRKKAGYYFAFIAQLVCIITPFVFMGIKYVRAEMSPFEYSLVFLVSCLLAIDVYLKPFQKGLK